MAMLAALVVTVARHPAGEEIVRSLVGMKSYGPEYLGAAEKVLRAQLACVEEHARVLESNVVSARATSAALPSPTLLEVAP